MPLIIINTKWYERFLEFFSSSIVVLPDKRFRCIDFLSLGETAFVLWMNTAHVHHMLERIRQGVSFSEALLAAGMCIVVLRIPLYRDVKFHEIFLA